MIQCSSQKQLGWELSRSESNFPLCLLPMMEIIAACNPHGQLSNEGHTSCVSNYRVQGTWGDLKTFLFSNRLCQRDILLQDEEQTFTHYPGKWQRAQQGVNISVPAFGAASMSIHRTVQYKCSTWLFPCFYSFSFWVQGFISEVNDNWWWDCNTCKGSSQCWFRWWGYRQLGNHSSMAVRMGSS